MKLWKLLVGAAAVLILIPGCGIKVPPIVVDCRITGCQAPGTSCKMDDTQVPATYKCLPDDPIPPKECPAQPSEAPVCPRGQEPATPPWACGQDTGWQWVAQCADQPHDPVCNPGETCGCFVLPPAEHDWRVLTCAPRDGYTVDCVENICSYKEVVATCPEACPEGQTCYDPKVGCEPSLPPSSCGLREKDLVATACAAPEFSKLVLRATKELGPNPGAATESTVEAQAKKNLQLLADKLGSWGWCAIAGQEAVFILRSDGLVEENHAVYFGDAGWTNNGMGKFIGCHKTSERIFGDMCPAPLPSLEKGKRKINARRFGRWVDATIITVMTCDYCYAIGSGCYGPDPPCSPKRCGCPMRMDGNPYRVPCELYAAGGGDPDVETDPPGKEVVLHDGNPWQVNCVGCQRLRFCTLDAEHVCSVWVDAP